MRIGSRELTKKINELKNTVPKKTTIPALQGILVKDGYLIASNMEMTVKAKIEGADNDFFIIPGKTFDLIANLPDGEVEITEENKTAIVIRMEKIQNKYKTIDPGLFSMIGSEKSVEETVTVKSEEFMGAVKNVLYAVPDTASMQMMSSLCLQAEKGRLSFIGLDGHVVAWKQMEHDGNFKVLIPKGTAEKLLSLGITGELRLGCNETFAEIRAENYEVYTRVANGEYYNFQTMFQDLPVRAAVNRKELLDAVTRAKLCCEEKIPVIFDIRENMLDISVKSSSSNYRETVILREGAEQSLQIGFNAKLVIETLKAFHGETVSIHLKTSKYPMIVDDEEGSFRAVILPVVIK
jgi:DNA polymerase III sliding clamp (beta) subunit (PCNA family)